MCLIVLDVIDIWVRIRSHQDLRQMHSALRQVEARFVRVVKRGNVSVRNRNMRSDLLVTQLLHAKLTTDLCLQGSNAHLSLIQQLLKLFLRVRCLQLVELSVNVRIRCEQPLFFSPL